jgi:hypothetical protein
LPYISNRSEESCGTMHTVMGEARFWQKIWGSDITSRYR